MYKTMTGYDRARCVCGIGIFFEKSGDRGGPHSAKVASSKPTLYGSSGDQIYIGVLHFLYGEVVR